MRRLLAGTAATALLLAACTGQAQSAEGVVDDLVDAGYPREVAECVIDALSKEQFEEFQQNAISEVSDDAAQALIAAAETCDVQAPSDE